MPPPLVENAILPQPATSYGLVLKLLFPSGKGPLDPSRPRIAGVCEGGSYAPDVEITR